MFALTALALVASASARPSWATLPTSSACSKICPGCVLNHPATGDPVPNKECVDCHDGCWPGQSFSNTPDHTCDCFAQLDFCKPGELPQETGGACPSCWPGDNHACDCVATIGFCSPPARLPNSTECKTICPGCVLNHPAGSAPVPNAECVACGVAPKEHCWPGKGFNATTDHSCDCFAALGFCKPGESPVYPPAGTVGKAACPSCWPGDSNHACDCFAAIPFCGN